MKRLLLIVLLSVCGGSVCGDTLGCTAVMSFGADFEFSWIGNFFKSSATGTFDTIHVWVEVTGSATDMKTAIYHETGNDGSFDTLVRVDTSAIISLSTGSSWRKFPLLDGTQAKEANEIYCIFGYSDAVGGASCDGDLGISCEAGCAADSVYNCPWALSGKGNFTTPWPDTIFDIGTLINRQVRIIATYVPAVTAVGHMMVIQTE